MRFVLIVFRSDGTTRHKSEHENKPEAYALADQLAFSGKAGPWAAIDDTDMTWTDYTNGEKFQIQATDHLPKGFALVAVIKDVNTRLAAATRYHTVDPGRCDFCALPRTEMKGEYRPCVARTQRGDLALWLHDRCAEALSCVPEVLHITFGLRPRPSNKEA